MPPPLGARVSSDGSWVHVDPDKLTEFIRGGGGPVMKDLDRRATNVQTLAKQLVGKRTTRLMRSIVKRPGVDRDGPYVLIVAEGVPYGYWHHEGNTRGWHGNPFLRNALEAGGR